MLSHEEVTKRIEALETRRLDHTRRLIVVEAILLSYKDRVKLLEKKMAEIQMDHLPLLTTPDAGVKIDCHIKLEVPGERICTECDHCVTNNGMDINTLAYVNYPDPFCSRHKNVITGSDIKCKDARSHETHENWSYRDDADDCGPEGKFWTPKDSPQYGLKGSCPERRKKGIRSCRRWVDQYLYYPNRRHCADRRKGGAA